MMLRCFVVCVCICLTSNVCSQSFEKTTAPSECYNSVAISDNGQYMAAAVCLEGGVWISLDSGVSWSVTAVPTSDENWFGISMSSSGQYMYVVSNAGGGQGNMYTSQNYGSTWSSIPYFSGMYFSCVTTDSSGSYVFATANLGDSGIWFSSDYGSSWKQSSVASGYWNWIATDDSGQFLAAVVSDGYIFTSSNYGQSFSQTSAPYENYYAISSDSSGQYLVAVVTNGAVYFSNNYGVTWSISNAPLGLNYHSVSSISSGEVVYAGVGDFSCCSGSIYVSNNFGQDWNLTEEGESFDSVAVAGSGGYVIASAYDNGLYVSQISGVPTSVPTNSPYLKPTAAPTPSYVPGSPTLIPTRAPTYLPGVPTPLPTSAPTVAAVDFAVSQVFSGISLSQYNDDSTANSASIAQTVAASILVSSTYVTVTNVASSSSFRRRRLSSSSSISVNYIVSGPTATYSSPAQAYDALSSALTESVVSGTFEQNLQTIAAANQCSALADSTAEYPTIVNLYGLPTAAPSTTPAEDTPLSAGAIVGIVIAVLVVVAAVMGCIFRKWFLGMVPASDPPRAEEQNAHSSGSSKSRNADTSNHFNSTSANPITSSITKGPKSPLQANLIPASSSDPTDRL